MCWRYFSRQNRSVRTHLEVFFSRRKRKEAISKELTKLTPRNLIIFLTSVEVLDRHLCSVPEVSIP